VDFKGNDPRFVAYLLRNTLRNYQSEKAAVPGVDRNVLHLLKVRVPDSPIEQEKIVSVLSAYDDLIDNNRRRIGLLEEAARLLYREWFVYFRFPGHEHVKITNGLPDGWARKPLGQMTTKIGSGATPRGGEAAYLSSGIPLIRSLNVYDDRFDAEGLAFIGEGQAAALDNVTVQSHDILLNITGASVARCCMAPERYLPARVNQHVMILRIDSIQTDPFFIHAAINSDERKRQLLSYATKGATREALTKDMMAAFELTMPPRSLMMEFGEISAASFAQRENLAAQNEKLRMARDLLLPRLMNGEITV
jgi:type I restriction enzyme S subunit